jgi:hypothetical protein
MLFELLAVIASEAKQSTLNMDCRALYKSHLVIYSFLAMTAYF